MTLKLASTTKWKGNISWKREAEGVKTGCRVVGRGNGEAGSTGSDTSGCLNNEVRGTGGEIPASTTS
jgi:hypothetical protein